MGKVALFATPNIEPELPWFPTEHEIQRHGRVAMQELHDLREVSRQIDNSTREKVAVLVSVLGMKDLANLCVDCALAEIVKLCERPDVYAVLDAYQQGKTVAKRKVG